MPFYFFRVLLLHFGPLSGNPFFLLLLLRPFAKWLGLAEALEIHAEQIRSGAQNTTHHNGADPGEYPIFVSTVTYTNTRDLSDAAAYSAVRKLFIKSLDRRGVVGQHTFGAADATTQKARTQRVNFVSYSAREGL